MIGIYYTYENLKYEREEKKGNMYNTTTANKQGFLIEEELL
jgi:hypothetical protein